MHLPGLFSPLRDYHAYRQCQTASMARNYAQHGMHFLSPEVDTEGPPVRAGTEFPLYSYLLAMLFSAFGTNELFGRLLSMVFAAWGAWYLYRLVQPRLGETIAFYSALVLCAIPIHIYFTRTVQPEPMALWGLIGFACYADLWQSGKRKAIYWINALLLAAIAPLLKLPFLYLIVGLWFFIAYDHGKWRAVFQLSWLALLLSVLGLCFAWYDYAKSAPVVLLPLGLSDHLANLAPVFSVGLWKDQFWSRFPELVFTYPGLLLAGAGFYNLRKAKSLFLLAGWTLTSLVYVVLLGGYGLMHKYTLLPVAPVAAVWIASGIGMLKGYAQGRFIRSVFLLILVIGIPVHAAFRIGHWYRVEYDYLSRVKEAIDRRAQPKDLVLVITHEKPQHLYYLHRYGYSLEPSRWKKDDVLTMLHQGVRFILIPTFDNAKRLTEWRALLRGKAELIEEDDDYLLYQSVARQG